MKTWMKVLLGLAAAGLILAGLGMALLVRSGRWKQVESMAGGILELKRGAETLEGLEREHPFTPPADGRLAEPRLLAYLEICETLLPFVKPYEAWMEAHAGKQGDFKDAVEAVGFMGKVSSIAAESCRSKGMSPHELAWTHRAIRKAVEEAQGRGAAPELQELLAALRKAEADPGISRPLKIELQQKLARHEAKARASQAPLTENAQLCLLHADRIQRADLGDFATLILESTAKGKRRGRG